VPRLSHQLPVVADVEVVVTLVVDVVAGVVEVVFTVVCVVAGVVAIVVEVVVDEAQDGKISAINMRNVSAIQTTLLFILCSFYFRENIWESTMLIFYP
jgi:Ca2+/Na+ antiporter